MKKMFRFVVFVSAPLLLLFSFGCTDDTNTLVLEIDGNPVEVVHYQEIESEFLAQFESGGVSYTLYDASELTFDILENRNGSMIIERCIGTVTDAVAGDGVVLNVAEGGYDYISYRGVDEHISDGTVILTYMVYNPESNYADDIIERYDFILNEVSL